MNVWGQILKRLSKLVFCKGDSVQLLTAQASYEARMRPRTLRSPRLPAEGDTSQEVPRRQRRRTWRRLLQVLLNCVKPTHETLFADVPNLSIENATKMSKVGSCGVAIGPYCVANLYQGELQ